MPREGRQDTVAAHGRNERGCSSGGRDRATVDRGAERQQKEIQGKFHAQGHTRYMYVVWRTSVSSPALSIQVFDHIELYAAGPIMTSTPKKGLLQTKGKNCTLRSRVTSRRYWTQILERTTMSS